jgi:hypothetical protein
MITPEFVEFVKFISTAPTSHVLDHSIRF